MSFETVFDGLLRRQLGLSIDQVRATPACELTARAGKYGGLDPRDVAAYRALRLTRDQINEDLDRAIRYKN